MTLLGKYVEIMLADEHCKASIISLLFFFNTLPSPKCMRGKNGQLDWTRGTEEDENKLQELANI